MKSYQMPLMALPNKNLGCQLLRFLLGISVVIIVFIGLFIRYHAAIKQSFWQDEVYIYNISSQYSPSQLIGFEHEDKSHPQLYYLLSHFLAKYNFSPLVLRMPSLAAFIPAALFIYLIGAIAFNRQVALIATIMFAVNPFFVNQGFLAKMYPLTYCFTLGGLYFAMKGISSGKYHWPLLSGLFTAISLYLDYSPIWYLLSLAAAGIASSVIYRNWRNIITVHLSLVFLIVGALFAVEIPFFVKNFPAAVKGESYLGTYRKWYIQGTLADFSGLWGTTVKVDQLMPDISEYFSWIPFIVSIILFWQNFKILAVASNSPLTIRGFFALFLISSYFVPVIIAYLFSWYSPIFNTRNLWVSGLPFLFGPAILFGHYRSGRRKILILGYIILLTLASIGRWGFYGKTDWEKFSDQLIVRPGKKVIVFLDFEGGFWGRLRPFTEYYLTLPKYISLQHNLKIYEIDLTASYDIRKISHLAKEPQLWILSNHDNAYELEQKKLNRAMLTEFQALLDCSKKPCDKVFPIYRD